MLLYTPLFTGLVFVLAGFLMLKFPPKKINGLYGYRTNSSMKSQERWSFAQTYAAKEMMKTGVVLLLLSLFGLLFSAETKTNSIIGLILLIAAAGSLFTRVERAIKKEFGETK